MPAYEGVLLSMGSRLGVACDVRHERKEGIMSGRIETLYCDHCGLENANCPVRTLPVDIDSANAGESAILCASCYDEIIQPNKPSL